MKRSDFLNAIYVVTAAVPIAAAATIPTKQIAGIGVPDTTLAREATEIARTAEPVEIFNHSLRTFLFAELVAAAKNIQHDTEIVYVASILHDTGLAPRYMTAGHPFEVDGADVARALLAKYNVEEQRQSLAWDAIALHDNGGIAAHKQPEVVLVNAGVGVDFGSYLDTLDKSAVKRVLEAAPRTNFIQRFVDAAAVVAKDKPYASAHSFIADVGYRKVPGFQLPNFYDEVVKDDPFAGY